MKSIKKRRNWVTHIPTLRSEKSSRNLKFKTCIFQTITSSYCRLQFSLLPHKNFPFKGAEESLNGKLTSLIREFCFSFPSRLIQFSSSKLFSSVFEIPKLIAKNVFYYTNGMSSRLKRKRSGSYNDLKDLRLSSIVLPKEIHLEILSWVPFEDLDAVSQSCKFWNVIEKSQHFWKLFAAKHKAPYQEVWNALDWQTHLIHQKLKTFMKKNAQIVSFPTFLELIDGDIVFALELLQLLEEDINRCLNAVKANVDGKRCGFPPYR